MTFFLVEVFLLKIALANLFSNAWKYTSKTENARIEAVATEKNAKTVYFDKDKGVVFDPPLPRGCFCLSSDSTLKKSLRAQELVLQ